MSQPAERPLPTAAVRRTRGTWTLWLIPLAALLFIGALVGQHLWQRGIIVTLETDDGHGIKARDAVRCRGITVGQVESVRLNSEQSGVELVMRLDRAAGSLARAGSRWWIERPRIALDSIRGLETVIGARYITVEPGNGPRQTHFVALSEPPIVEVLDPAGLEIIVFAAQRRGLRAGAPVLYRQVPIGRVLTTALASDARSIEARLYIEPAYTRLVREDSRFWLVSGAQLSLGITGVQLDVDSLASLVSGGVALATPDPPGEPVVTGHRFELFVEPDDDWLEWRPALAVGSELLPRQAMLPGMLRATVTRRKGTLWTRTRESRGWLLPMAGGLVGPGDWLAPADDDEAQLEVAGQSIPLHANHVTRLDGLARLNLKLGGVNAWPDNRIRRADTAEDCLLLTDTAAPQAVAAARLEPFESPGRWRIDPAITFEPAMQGAAVIARSDGRLIGLLQVKDGRGFIAPLLMDGD